MLNAAVTWKKGENEKKNPKRKWEAPQLQLKSEINPVVLDSCHSQKLSVRRKNKRHKLKDKHRG